MQQPQIAYDPESELRFDAEVFQQSTMGDPTLARMVVDAFLKSCPRLLDDFALAIEENRLADAKRAVHTLKGSSLTLGMQGLATLCQQLENLVSAGHHPMEARIHELRNLYDHSAQFLKLRYIE